MPDTTLQSHRQITADVAAYYTAKVLQHGTTPQGADWKSLESQILRFEQLLRVAEKPFTQASLLDYGCGHGTLLEHLGKSKNSPLAYVGYDLSAEMLRRARDLHGEDENTRWVAELPAGGTFDYVVASGIFNVRVQRSDDEWFDYILATLREFDRLSRQGFSFNVLTKYSDPEYMTDRLYYADPVVLFDFCRQEFSRRVALLHDYPLYEFTIVVRK